MNSNLVTPNSYYFADFENSNVIQKQIEYSAFKFKNCAKNYGIVQNVKTYPVAVFNQAYSTISLSNFKDSVIMFDICSFHSYSLKGVSHEL